MRDGVRLATDVYVPAGRGPWPTVLVRHPYAPCEFMPPSAAYLNEHGYAAVVQVVRGKERSEGEPVPFVHDAADAHDTLDWIEAQGWSDGRVAMFGDSYFGFTQWAASVTGHRALRALAPRMTSTDIGRDWMHHGGVFNFGPMVEWAVITWTGRDLREVVPDWGVRPPAAVLRQTVPDATADVVAEWRERGPDHPFWSRGIYGRERSPAERVGVPVLHRGAWWDVFQRGQLADWATAAQTSRHEQLLVMDATDHYDDPWVPEGPAPADMLASVDAFLPYVPRYLDEAIAFFDVHLRDRPRRRPPAPVRFHLANGPWREAASWPPEGSGPLELHLAGDGLATAPDRRRSEHAWVHDPADPAPSLVDPWRPLLDLQDERELDGRDDVLRFCGEPAAAPLDLAGPAAATLRVGSEAASMQVVAKLCDVLPDGRVLRIAEGACRVRPAGGEAVAELGLGHLGYRLPPGHRLRLDVAASSHPRYLPDPGSDADPWTSEPGPPRRQRLLTGGAAGSTLRLTSLPPR